MSTYRELITLGEKQLLTVNSSYEARLLMLELLRERQLDLYLIEDKPADPVVKELFLAGLKRLIAEEPLAYILGYTWFYGRKYQVNQRDRRRRVVETAIVFNPLKIFVTQFIISMN